MSWLLIVFIILIVIVALVFAVTFLKNKLRKKELVESKPNVEVATEAPLTKNIQVGSYVVIKDQPERGIWIVTEEKPAIDDAFTIRNIKTNDIRYLKPEHLQLVAI